MKKNRDALKGYFKKGDIPTQEQFADLIDSMLTQDDDNISKLPNDPLRITASGAEEKLLNFYRVGEDGNPTWQIKLNLGGKSGLSIGDATTSRLFIESGTGNVGIGTTDPGSYKLNVQGGDTNLGGSLTVQGTTDLVGNMVAHGSLQVVGTSAFSGNVGIGTNSPGAKLDVRADAQTARGWYEAIRFSQDAHSAITHPGGGLLFGLHSDRSFYFADIAGGEFQKYVLKIEAGTGNVGIGTDSPGAKLHVTGPVMEQLEMIRCGNREDWTALDHPIMQYFKAKLQGKPIGTYIKAIQDNPGWRGHYWQGWVDADNGIRVIHNAHNTGAVIPAAQMVLR
jgi:hypothetical protein